ncbi:malonate decarboxylase subunit alpha [Nonomuraea jiangxiensis]|uniref:Malonate decarboxylase alpha subunit n=1 Tax=Nonomuraea jiangxiensis TaxID=633440 RepID=A0A1G8TH09_9ACTN|nr:malonate decarboxylase subunit alpha [Nonomuraea jiangxiensis]SDJ40717.1 malonate decarboxylase alpha subunit [Nonomuraea jiangxiensis]
MASTVRGSRDWARRRTAKQERLEALRPYVSGRVLDAGRIGDALQALLRPGDRVAIEGDNQKQADFLAEALAGCDPDVVHDLHLLISSISLREHLDVFERGVARRLDFAYAGPQSVRMAQLLADGKVEVRAIHTYVELYARMFVDLTPNVALLCAEQADHEGNLFTGPSTEDTPTIAEAVAFSGGVNLVQVNKLVDKVPRVDIPGDWVDLIVESPRPFALEPLFTRDPRHIGQVEILMAMMALRGIYERHGVVTLNHGIGYDTAAIELLLPTYGEELGLRGKICRHWTLNPHPTLIPAIESGWVESVHCFGGEPGMERYVAARPDVFFTGHDGSLRSNRVLCQLAGQYAVDMFIGSSLQIDAYANSSTVTEGRLTGYGGAPNMGHDARGRRHPSATWLKLLTGQAPAVRGRKIVAQITQTFRSGGTPAFVESLDAVQVGKDAGLPIPPIMIYGDDVSHVVTEEGVAYLYKAEGPAERREAVAAIAGATPIGRRAEERRVAALRRDGLVALPEDLKVDVRKARRSLLAARSIEDLVAWSGGLYDPPARFRTW